MKYSKLHPNAEPFEEPQALLFRTLDPYRCLWCKDPAPWLTYRFERAPVPVCSGECMDQLEQLAAE
jgi:hypothetical protein